MRKPSLAVVVCALSSNALSAPQAGTLTAVEIDQFGAAPSGATNSRFGRSLRIDGNTLLVGSGGPGLLTRLEALVGSTVAWALQADLSTPGLGENAIAISRDLAAACVPNFGGQGVGRVLIARRNGTSWTTSWRDSPEMGAATSFAADVAIEFTILP